MIEIQVLGRGGLGVVSTAKIIGLLAINLGLNATSIPRFGAERRGAPVHADIRISKDQIKLKSFIEKGDLIVVLDDTAFSLSDILNCTKERGILLINSKSSEKYSEYNKNYNILVFDATGIALKEFNTLLPNIIILGTLSRIFMIKDENLLIEPISKTIPQLKKDQIKAMIKEGVKQMDKDITIKLI